MPMFEIELRKVIRMVVAIEADEIRMAMKAVREAYPGYEPGAVLDADGGTGAERKVDLEPVRRALRSVRQS